ncbi:hypothetical protein RHGRI_030136 [Rhododendron griersonianum]|uniref:Enoyl reductase (ER) domain-containing protein n=1 Tax=Rhododendron griersonianum TaxID=479676 RepID=A0AAV6IMX6_9ERIC|nr:hypothetical protein RHGRI_030136 [Rhododendron griersonianum]
MAKAPEEDHPVRAFGWATRDTSGVLSPFNFSRRVTEDEDVRFKIFYCGICHSDLHSAKNEWGNSSYPLLPGHELVGVVTEVGSKVQKYKVGDRVGVGCMVGACHTCENCENNLENYCPKMILTYNSMNYDGTMTYGGYSDHMVANQRYIIRIPDNLPLDVAAPLLCAGITTYSPLRYFGLDKSGMKVGVVGLGGLGHLAVKFAKAFGAVVTVISTSPSKKQEAIKVLGADSFLVSSNSNEMQSHGKIITVGAPEKPLELPVFPLIMGRKLVAGSLIGGMKETQEMIDFAGMHNITPEIEVVPMDYVNTAMERLAKADVKYRFVLDVANTLNAA